MAEPAAAEKPSQTYPGGCHCGYIRFDVTLRPPLAEQKVMNCSCSICQRGGYLLVYPDAADVAWRGASRERCAVYRFNTRRKQQLFCPRCGVGLGIDYSGVPGRTDYGISVRTLDGVDLHALAYQKSDGVSRVPPKDTDLSVTTYLEDDREEQGATHRL